MSTVPTIKPVIDVEGEFVTINCAKTSAHGLVIAFIKARQEGATFTPEATNLINALSNKLIGKGVTP